MSDIYYGTAPRVICSFRQHFPRWEGKEPGPVGTADEPARFDDESLYYSRAALRVESLHRMTVFRREGTKSNEDALESSGDT